MSEYSNRRKCDFLGFSGATRFAREGVIVRAPRDLLVYKWVNASHRGEYYGKYMVTLLIPKGTEVRFGLYNEKCRAQQAKVLSIEPIDGAKPGASRAYSWYNPDFRYRVGETIEVKRRLSFPAETCEAGIHFYLTKREVSRYAK